MASYMYGILIDGLNSKNEPRMGFIHPSKKLGHASADGKGATEAFAHYEACVNRGARVALVEFDRPIGNGASAGSLTEFRARLGTRTVTVHAGTIPGRLRRYVPITGAAETAPTSPAPTTSRKATKKTKTTDPSVEEILAMSRDAGGKV